MSKQMNKWKDLDEVFPTLMHMSQKEAAKALGIHVCTLKKYWRIYRCQTGEKRWPSKTKRKLMNDTSKVDLEIDTGQIEFGDDFFRNSTIDKINLYPMARETKIKNPNDEDDHERKSINAKLSRMVGELHDWEKETCDRMSPSDVEQFVLTFNIHEMCGVWNSIHFLSVSPFTGMILMDSRTNVIAMNDTYAQLFRIDADSEYNCDPVKVNHFDQFMETAFSIEYFISILNDLQLNQTYSMTDYLAENDQKTKFQKYVCTVMKIGIGYFVTLEPTNDIIRFVILDGKSYLNDVSLSFENHELEHIGNMFTLELGLKTMNSIEKELFH